MRENSAVDAMESNPRPRSPTDKDTKKEYYTIPQN